MPPRTAWECRPPTDSLPVLERTPALAGVVGAGLFEHAGQRHRDAALALALVGRLHEGEDLDRLLGADRGLAGAEEPGDLDQERLVAAATAEGLGPLAADDGRPVAALALADAAEGAEPAVLPRPGHEV